MVDVFVGFVDLMREGYGLDGDDAGLWIEGVWVQNPGSGSIAFSHLPLFSECVQVVSTSGPSDGTTEKEKTVNLNHCHRKMSWQTSVKRKKERKTTGDWSRHTHMPRCNSEVDWQNSARKNPLWIGAATHMFGSTCNFATAK